MGALIFGKVGANGDTDAVDISRGSLAGSGAVYLR